MTVRLLSRLVGRDEAHSSKSDEMRADGEAEAFGGIEGATSAEGASSAPVQASAVTDASAPGNNLGMGGDAS